MVVAANGLRELGQYTLWVWHQRPQACITDVLMLRHYALESLANAIRHAHQIHGAIGFAHEHPLADLTMSAYVYRQSPLRQTQITELLAARADEIERIFGARERERHMAAVSG
jgi:alkylation response protein AidB-like acyl-CoA dehydrogenase